jgi:hypothetical protein
VVRLWVIVRDTSVQVEVHEVVVGLASACLSEARDFDAGVSDQFAVVRAVLDGG